MEEYNEDPGSDKDRNVPSEAQIAFLVKNLESIMTESGDIYIHAGHLVELYEAGSDLIEELPKQGQELGMDPDDPRIVYNAIGIRYMIDVISMILSGLQAKHADEVKLPMDELVSDLSELLKEGEEE